MLSRIYSSTLWGIDAVLVHIEVQIFGALRRFSIVGLPDGVVREAKERVRCAIENSGFPFPTGEVIVNLAPADLPKAGSAFDLAIACGILAALGLISPELFKDKILLGELALDGSVKPVRGALAAACLAKSLDFGIIASTESAEEARLVDAVQIYAVDSLAPLVANCCEGLLIPLPPRTSDGEDSGGTAALLRRGVPGFGDVAGQHAVKRAVEVAAAGWHNMLMMGPPGAGKSMIARRLESILPEPTFAERIAVAKIHSADTSTSGVFTFGASFARPFRSPHHTVSTAGLVGGGSLPGPGEVSLAHHGVLFLDELPHMKRDALEALREPLETQQVVISRAKQRLSFPADFLLIAAMNPCPCGKRGTGVALCACAPGHVKRYVERISGPILDRIDLQVWVPPVSLSELAAHQEAPESTTADPTQKMAGRVLCARERQRERDQTSTSGVANSRLTPAAVRKHCRLKGSSTKLLIEAAKRYELSARGYSRILKVARTIADLEGSEEIADVHVSEALAYRMTATAT